MAYLLRESKNCDKEESGKRVFELMISGKKEVHFFGKGYCEKCTGMKQQRKRKAKSWELRVVECSTSYIALKSSNTALGSKILQYRKPESNQSHLDRLNITIYATIKNIRQGGWLGGGGRRRG